ncbi:MAG: Copper-translocating P-type ATPase [Desulfotomaculum sp. 46_296]|nr:MAG: Copper-translocating P-type ATPase [Desulfotomaculum sp. 46_296]HAU30695.1 hypothetical protein [Desulfotomaculum sp.]
MKKETIKISGMSCAACAARIEKKLNSLDGIRKASVNLTTEKANIAYQPGRVKVEEMISAIQTLGYSAENIGEIDNGRQIEQKELEIKVLRLLLLFSPA